MTTTYPWGTMPEMFGPRHEHRIGLILRETGKLPAGSLLLEAAIGLGQLAGRLEAQEHRVFGIDSSFEAALYVRRNTKTPVVVGSLTSMPFRSAVFDAVTSGETLEHIPDDRAAASEMGRILREGGECVVTVPALEALRTFSDEYYEHLRRYSRGDLEKLFSSNGFEVRLARFWGFPLVLAYDTLFILPMNRRRARHPVDEDRALQSIARVGRSGFLVRLARMMFATDRLFSFVPIGVGLLLVAVKREG